jgi:hypothetical protein
MGGIIFGGEAFKTEQEEPQPADGPKAGEHLVGFGDREEGIGVMGGVEDE